MRSATISLVNCQEWSRKRTAYNIESEEVFQETSAVRIHDIKERAVFAKMLVKQQPVGFQIRLLKYAEGEELAPCPANTSGVEWYQSDVGWYLSVL